MSLSNADNKKTTYYIKQAIILFGREQQIKYFFQANPLKVQLHTFIALCLLLLTIGSHYIQYVYIYLSYFDLFIGSLVVKLNSDRLMVAFAINPLIFTTS